MHPLAARRVLITGGSRGIGRATALACAQAGAGVVVCYRRDHAAAESLTKELERIGGPHRVVAADITDEPDVAQLMKVARETLGGLDAVVNNAGVDGHARFAELSSQEWSRVVDANLTGAFLVTQAALDLLGDGASIVTIGASVALRGRPNGVHYAASKAALIGFTRSLAKELGSRGIRVNTVAPGVVETEPGEALPPPVLARIKGMTALGRLGSAEDVVDAVLYLIGDSSRYVTGTTLNVDGGM